MIGPLRSVQIVDARGDCVTLTPADLAVLLAELESAVREGAEGVTLHCLGPCEPLACHGSALLHSKGRPA